MHLMEAGVVGSARNCAPDQTHASCFAFRLHVRPSVELAETGKYITLRNAKIDMFRGSMRLAVDQWGKVEAYDGNFEAKVRFVHAHAAFRS